MTDENSPSIGSLAKLALLTALVGSFGGGILFGLVLLVGAGLEDLGRAVGGVLGMAFFAGIVGFVLGLPVLLLVGIPVALRWRGLIARRPQLSLMIGAAAGATAAALVGGLLGFGTGDIMLGALLIGAVYGFTWVRMLQDFAIDVDDGEGADPVI